MIAPTELNLIIQMRDALDGMRSTDPGTIAYIKAIAKAGAVLVLADDAIRKHNEECKQGERAVRSMSGRPCPKCAGTISFSTLACGDCGYDVS